MKSAACKMRMGCSNILHSSLCTLRSSFSSSCPSCLRALRGFPILMLLLTQACASPPKPPPGADSPRALELSHGYAILYDLVSKQSGLGRALIIGGGMSEPTKALIREIAEASREATGRIKAFADVDASVVL